MSNSVVIKAENISKQYRLGSVGTGTLSHDLNRWWSQIRGKEDPYLKIGELNDRTQKGDSDYVWSLKNIDFEIHQGDAVGIIGRNGAGKSTLLKILSKVTKPTTGNIYTKGRIASLLEVGTGFHPEMTGRENIYLNGAILGMTKKEISRKFDEIVDFSGVERYIDTPVKRYSSGMYVRLAFAVAAHLESEILIVDEVLAVGDAEFQKKCLGKMGNISKGEGRTVLFVSHNMAAISNLCKTSIFLENGKIVTHENTTEVINKYIKTSIFKNQEKEEKVIVLEDITIRNPSFNNSYHNEVEINQGDDIVFTFEVEKMNTDFTNLFFNIELKTFDGIPVTSFGNEFQKFDIKITKGKFKIEVFLGECNWKHGEYSVNYYFQLREGISLNCNTSEDVFLINVNKSLLKNDYWNRFIGLPQHGSIPLKWESIKVLEL